MPSAPDSPAAERASSLDLTAVYDQHGDFVWASLQRLGVRSADLEDQFQEVFIVVHRKHATYDPDASLRSWLYGICVRVASTHRRSAWVRREKATDSVSIEDPPRDAGAGTPEEQAEARQARAQLAAILDDMDLEKRALFVMYELDEQSCEEIASTLGVPVGTVYSRLHAARKEFDRSLSRWKARAAHGTGGPR